ncbi:MAG: glycosyltransferase family 39 protein [Sphingomicrobium sp.]
MDSNGNKTANSLNARGPAIILVALILLGLALRAVAIGREPLWADEALTAILVRYPWWSFPFTALDPTPPLFYWLEKALVPEGAGPVAWRMLSLVAGTVTIPLVYWLAREMHSRSSGLMAAGLVAVSAPLIDYSQEARAYALTVAMIAGSAAALAALTGGRLAGADQAAARRRMLALFAMFTALAIFSHFIAMLWVLPALAVLRLAAHGDRRTLKPREMVLTMAAILPFLAIEIRREFLYRSENNAFTWLTQLAPLDLLHLLARQWLPFVSSWGWLATGIGAAALCALLWKGRAPLVRWARKCPPQALILAILLLEPLGLWLLGELGVPVAMPRTVLPAVLGFAVLVGIAIAVLEGTTRKVAAMFAIALSLASTLMVGTVRPKEAWGAAAEITRGAPFVLSCPNWKTPAYLAQARAGGSVLTAAGDHALAVRQPGDRSAWDRLYFERVQRFGFYRVSDERISLQPRPIIAKRLLFVASECSDAERAVFAKWAGLQQSKLLWASPATGDAAGIRVEDWRLRGDTPLRLWIIR